ncbi:MAG: hypothetical protein GY903_28155 [Fuerstiella sp.]|nr:hypothetical protein [Fuerstiella sp.]MCP4858369.1 hypothetical protein [Fuerstiella sp.]
MIPNKLMTILIAGTLLGTSGCSGTRLRSLITRSDYVSLEELEAQDAAAVAESKESESSESLVSSEQEASEDDANAAEKKKKSWFSFAALLGRSSDDSELGPDPFVDTEEVGTEKVVVTDASDDINEESLATEAAVVKATEKYSATITDVEDQAEGLFDKLAAQEVEAAIDERIKEMPEIMPASGILASDQQSFADFIAQHDDTDARSVATEVQSRLKESVAEVKQASPFATEAAEPVIAAIKKADNLSDFDRLFGEASAAAVAPTTETPIKDPFTSELFPELDSLIVDGDVGPSVVEQSPVAAASPEFDLRNPPRPDVETLDSAADPFQLAARKHGFNEVSQDDPWAAFLNKQDGDDAQTSGDVETQNAGGADGFVWGDQTQAAEPAPFPVVENATGNSDIPLPLPVFQQASSSNRPARVTGGAQLSTDLSAGLTISTTSAPQPVPHDNFEQFGATTAEPVSWTEAVSEPADADFADAFDATMAAASPEAKTGSSVTATSGWPMRTWIFLVGFAVVAYLLFAPARQNRPRA